ncbi:hypothetical protein GGS20DRAFT_524816 [Poronia punctata]|nr:hypothetical protein GGS20DRAFT_524816 [Poronia punctata]
MAGPSPDFQFPNTSFFNIYTDTPQVTHAPSLPGGPCNYVDLSHGPNGQKCGCRRFWRRIPFSVPDGQGQTGYPPVLSNGYEDQAAWCMCSHHACFHDDVRDSPAQSAINPVVTSSELNGQENERPRTMREPLTPVMPDLSFKFSNSFGNRVDFDAFLNSAMDSDRTIEAPRPNAKNGPTQEYSIPDTLGWTSLVQPETEQAGSLAPIPSQCLMASQPSSTTSSARIAYLKPFSGKGLQTLSGVKSKAAEPPREMGHVVEPGNEDAEGIDKGRLVNTDLDVEADGDDIQTVTNTPKSTRNANMDVGLDQSPELGVNRTAFHLLSATVQGHEQRIENLEGVSFSAAAHDVCHEKHDQADLRVTELESRVEEVEKILNDNGSSASGHSMRRPAATGLDDATASVASVPSSVGSYTADREELYSELRFLKAQLKQLQGISAVPSPFCPWEVEVIFLPFPLRNVWLDQRDPSSQRVPGGGSVEADAWTQLPNNFEPQSPAFSDWAGPEVDTDWLVGRACSPDNLIGQRLKSRGLVKNITVRGPDAHSVHHAMSEAFGTMFRTFSRLQGKVHHGSVAHPRITKFLGLQSPWVPLRKVHKESRLRFLTPAEMVTPVSWDFQFLVSSIVMKSQGVHRLFITHPEAYLQNLDAYENGWNWQRLRELSRVYGDSQGSQEIPEGDAKEDCWVWHNVLDETPLANSHSSRAQDMHPSAPEHWRAMSASAGPWNGPMGTRIATPSLTLRRSGSRAQSPAVSRERQSSRPPRFRTTSLPPAAQALVPSLPKRRITSHGHPHDERHVSPQPARVPQRVPLAKRRSTRSPSFQRRLNRYTPRYSTASPSPLPELHGLRATTPFYATPYSNAPFTSTRPYRGHGADGDGTVHFGVDEGDSGSEINIYEDDAMESDSEENIDFDEEERDDSSMVDLGHDTYRSRPHSRPRSNESWQEGQVPSAPEDEPWAGIDDDENCDPHINLYSVDDVMGGTQDEADTAMTSADEDETQSQGSSAPSEYPSTEPNWVTSGREQEFRIFEDTRHLRG